METEVIDSMKTKSGEVELRSADLLLDQGRYSIAIRFSDKVEGYLNLFDYKRSIINDGIVFVLSNTDLPTVKHVAPGGNEFEFAGATRDPHVVALFKSILYKIETASSKPKLGFIDIDIDRAWAEVQVPPSGENWVSAESLGVLTR